MPKIHDTPDGRYTFRCPGCGDTHTVSDNWSFNKDYDKPTFSPSILVRCGHYVPGHEDQCWCKFYAERPDEKPVFECYQCHSFVADGKIQFLSDCSHKLAGQTVEIPDWDED